MCVAGAIQNFTTQLSHYREGTSDRRRKNQNSKFFILSVNKTETRENLKLNNFTYRD